MAKEICISSTPHETRLAILEDDQLAEIYYERENEYTLAGSIYKGRVTRVLPGMQSSFVDVGLERDAFLYVTDFLEEQEDSEEYTSEGNGGRRDGRPRSAAGANSGEEPQLVERGGQDRGGQDRGGQDRSGQDRSGQDRSGQDRGGRERDGEARLAEPRADRPAEPRVERSAELRAAEPRAERNPERNPDRGERGRRGPADTQTELTREQNREQSRLGRERARELAAAPLQEAVPAAQDLEEKGDDEAPEGTRRWRGRRGRRRGVRGGLAQPITQGRAVLPGQDQPEVSLSSQPGTSFETADETGSIHESGAFGLGPLSGTTSIEASAQAAEPSEGHAQGDDGGRQQEQGMPGRSGRDRGRDRTPRRSREPYAQASTLDRTGQDRAAQDRAGLDLSGAPGFWSESVASEQPAPVAASGYVAPEFASPGSPASEPAAPAYGRFEGSPAGLRPASGSVAGNTLLPGESISKYGSQPASTGALGAAAPVATASVPRPAARPVNFVAPKPSTLVELGTDWDGGAVLPGESLSRYRSPSSAVSPAPAATQHAFSASGEPGKPGQHAVPGSGSTEPGAVSEPSLDQVNAVDAEPGQSVKEQSETYSEEQSEPQSEPQASTPHPTQAAGAFEAVADAGQPAHSTSRSSEGAPTGSEPGSSFEAAPDLEPLAEPEFATAAIAPEAEAAAPHVTEPVLASGAGHPGEVTEVPVPHQAATEQHVTAEQASVQNPAEQVPEQPTEYEPENASASYRVPPTGASELRLATSDIDVDAQGADEELSAPQQPEEQPVAGEASTEAHPVHDEPAGVLLEHPADASQHPSETGPFEASVRQHGERAEDQVFVAAIEQTEGQGYARPEPEQPEPAAVAVPELAGELPSGSDVGPANDLPSAAPEALNEQPQEHANNPATLTILHQDGTIEEAAPAYEPEGTGPTELPHQYAEELAAHAEIVPVEFEAHGFDFEAVHLSPEAEAQQADAEQFRAEGHPAYAHEDAQPSTGFTPVGSGQATDQKSDQRTDLGAEHPDVLATMVSQLQGFAPGNGLLEEEVMDEEEYDFEPIHPSHAHADEGDQEDLEEETIDQQMEYSTLSDAVRDSHLEQRVQQPEATTSPVAEQAATADFHTEFQAEEEEGVFGFEEVDEDEEEGEGEESPLSAQPGDPQRAGRSDEGRGAGRGRGRQGRNGRRTGGSGGGGRGRSAQSQDLPVISDMLKQGQEILVQIAKEPMAKKGARITSHIALPGRFLVFMPTVNHVGVSRKIASDEERQRLKRILISEKGESSGGFIVRTAAEGASEEDLRADLRFLISLWTEVKQRSETAKAPALIYHDLNLIERILRDQVSSNFSTIWVDSEVEYERIIRFLSRFQPALVRRVKLYTKETPLFEHFGIQEEISKALKSKVWLKSGGSIVINQTEALVAIDINTGKYVGKTARLEDTIVKTNLDAIEEIVRQIRLRDLGGIIVIDFIDMDERKNRNRVLAALEEALKADRAPSKVLQFNDFGLVAITRKRVKQSLERTLSVQCEVCTGTGMVKSPITVCNEIYTEMRKMLKHLDGKDVMLRVHPEVVKQLKAANGRWINELEEMVAKTIIIKSDPALHPEQFDIH